MYLTVDELSDDKLSKLLYTEVEDRYMKGEFVLDFSNTMLLRDVPTWKRMGVGNGYVKISVLNDDYCGGLVFKYSVSTTTGEVTFDLDTLIGEWCNSGVYWLHDSYKDEFYD